MKNKITLTVIGVLVVLACLFVIGFLMSSRFSNSPMFRGPGASGSTVAPGGLVAATADGKTIPAPADAPKLAANTASQRTGNLNVTLAVSPYPPTSFQSGSFDITLTDEKGQPVSDASVSLDLTMPAMPMPPSKPIAQAVGNGSYHASAFWTMRGQWLIQVIITRGNEKQSAFFSVWL